MTEQDFWQQIHPPGSFATSPEYTDAYPAVFDDGSQLLLPIRTLPDGENAVASLIINQASFAVLAAIVADLCGKLRSMAPEIIVGLPTLGLTLAAAVAQCMGHVRYIPLGTSRKFWYLDKLSIPLSSITSPDQKRLYIDPRMLSLLQGRRVAVIDDVISSGVSMAASLRLLALCECTPVVLGAAMVQSEGWRGPLAGVPAAQLVAVLKTPLLTRTKSSAWAPKPDTLAEPHNGNFKGSLAGQRLEPSPAASSKPNETN